MRAYACVCKHQMCVDAQGVQKKSMRLPGAGVTLYCQPHGVGAGNWAASSGRPGSVFTTEPSLQPLDSVFKNEAKDCRIST